MKKQGYNARLGESLGMRHKGAHKQSLKAREHESKGMEKAEGKKAYSGDKGMDKGGDHMKHLKAAMHHLRKAHKSCK